MSAYEDMNVYWGDFHKHLMNLDAADAIIQDAKCNLDFYPVLCYPFNWYKLKGLRIETVRQHPEFQERWKRLQNAARKHNEPGTFVTFLGYEWHGNRTRWGDHNVIYFDEDNPLDDAWELEELYENLRSRKAVAIPHHTAYLKGRRGKDWTVCDTDLSPVMEIYSAHGCSEGIDSPVGLSTNQSMGPRASGGTLVDALNAGHHIGVIASNDGPGLPGSWNRGVAGIWAEELTREAIWNGLLQRRTYGVTGDRIELRFSINDFPMGSIIRGQTCLEAEVNIMCAQPLDRVELIHNAVVVETYCHRGRWERREQRQGVYKILLECGWGPSRKYGFEDTAVNWHGVATPKNGRIVSVQPRFTTFGQSFDLQNDTLCTFDLTTTRDDAQHPIQGLVLEVAGDLTSELCLEIDGYSWEVPFRDIQDKTILFPLMEESGKRILRDFRVQKTDQENPDVFFANARKIRVNPAYPKESYNTEIKFKDLPVTKGHNYYYVRASQIDGQMAWSSPIWVCGWVLLKV